MERILKGESHLVLGSEKIFEDRGPLFWVQKIVEGHSCLVWVQKKCLKVAVTLFGQTKNI